VLAELGLFFSHTIFLGQRLQLLIGLRMVLLDVLKETLQFGVLSLVHPRVRKINFLLVIAEGFFYETFGSAIIGR
jgi:hypothetical protein